MQTTSSAADGDADAKAEGLTPTSYAILALLALRDWSGYQIAKQGRVGLGQLWPRAERQLYNDPKRLVDGGYAAATAGSYLCATMLSMDRTSVFWKAGDVEDSSIGLGPTAITGGRHRSARGDGVLCAVRYHH